MSTRHRSLRAVLALATTCLSTIAVLATGAVPARADSYVPVSGAGSTWSQNAIDQWRRNVAQYGLRIDYAGTGSSDGRNQFRNGTVDFGVSEIPYGLTDSTGTTDAPPNRGYAYMPIVAGGTSFMYNLKIAGQQVTNLRLSGDVIAKIFTGGISVWNDPAVAADNPGLTLPATPITPVVRSDGSGTTAQFTSWMASEHQDVWGAYCAANGLKTPCPLTSEYPVLAGKGFTAQSGSLGTAGYVAQAQNEGAITYVEYSYALNANFPVAKVLNNAGYYVEPTAQNVAVALLQAKINTDKSSPAYLTPDLSGVYRNPDSRTYPLSSYSYMIVPTKDESNFSDAKGKSLGSFAYYFLCEGQQQAPDLGYSPLPINLVQAGFDQVKNIPGVDVQSINIAGCNNPTFSADGSNTLAKDAPQPSECDKKGANQCNTGTGGAANKPTQVKTAGGSSTTGGKGIAKKGAVSSAKASAAPVKAGARPTASTAVGAGTPTTAAVGSGGSTGSTGGAANTLVDPSAPEAAAAVDPSVVGAVTDTSGSGATSAGDGSGTAATTDTGSSDAGQPVVATPVTLSARSTTGSSSGLTVLAVLLLLAVVVVPPVLSKRLNGRDQL